MKRFLTPTRFVPFISGCLMTLNFLIFWAIPVGGMGNLYKQILKPYLQPIYLFLEGQPFLRKFAANYIYSKPEHADFFALSWLLLVNCSISIPAMFYWQLKYGYLPFWLIFLYYCSWVGIGGSMMGAAYALAHKEGHNPRLYKKWLQSLVGNINENIIGVFFGNVPWNFTTSHIKIHHAVNGGIGDTFYLWDFDRSDPGMFMLYVHRIFYHMIGLSSLRFFRANGRNDKADLLMQGIYTYLGAGLAMWAITRSVSFVFWMIVEPLLCMTYFLALINIGFHGFLEFDAQGNHISVINATTIVDGEDDMFGEDDHMAHHYHTGVYYRDLPKHQQSKIEEFKAAKASVFRKVSIVELSIFIIFGLWDKLAEHYVDYTGKMTAAEIVAMLKERAQRVEMQYEDYEEYARNPTADARKKLRGGVVRGDELPASYEKDDEPSVPPSVPSQ